MEVACSNCNNILGIPTLTCRKGVIINRSLQNSVCLAGEDSSPANNETLWLNIIFVPYVYHPFRYAIQVFVYVVTFYAGVLSQFSPPSGDICPGSDIEFSCVGNSLLTSNTRWDITPDGGEPACIVIHNQPTVMQNCGPGDIFRSSLDVNAEVNYTSSLRAEDVPLSLNWTVVECVDGADLQPIGSTNICIVGEHEALYCMYMCMEYMLALHS